jgi:hypothetical protein
VIVGLDPSSGPLLEEGGEAAARPHSLDGVVVGLVSNGLGRSDDILERVAKELTQHHAISRVVAVRKPSVSVPPDPIDWEKLINEVTVAVAGFGG